ncbi:MAG: CRISPR-associated helicase Cas3' [Elusimicrobiales bacterium]|nr:CRISPR-associated helicase Cas3' [Elusimicrobiales bacterium]
MFSHSNNRKLVDHLRNVAELSKNKVKSFSLNLPFKKEILEEISYLIGFYHDFGKATSFFQKYLKEEQEEKRNFLKNQLETKHSFISALAAFFAVKEYLNNTELSEKYKNILKILSFVVVKKHHSDLDNLRDEILINDGMYDVIKKQIESINEKELIQLPYVKEVISKIKNCEFMKEFRLSFLDKTLREFGESDFAFPYLLTNFVYSVLLDSDKNDAVIESQIERVSVSFETIEKYKKIKFSNQQNTEINNIREEIYKKVIQEVNNLNLDRDKLLSFTAPTGCGKTVTSFAFALKLRERIKNEKNFEPRIIYCLPFLSIIDQNSDIIKEIFNNDKSQDLPSNIVLVHHHLSDYNYKTLDEVFDIDKSRILIETWSSEIIITTFVQFFHTLFSNKNSSLCKFNKIANSIVILDEIQTFPPKFWKLLETIAKELSFFFNTYFILSTATQPLIFENRNIKELLNDYKNYFKIFDRTKLKIEINNKSDLSVDELAEKIKYDYIKDKNSLLVVLNTVNSASYLYNLLKDFCKNNNISLYFLSSHITPYERRKRISDIKNNKSCKILISTQLIEAGVDIDFDKAIRDIGPLDSINQVAGRVNRNNEKSKGEVCIVRIKDVKNSRSLWSYIYDSTFINKTEIILKNKNEVAESEFISFIEEYYKKLRDSITNDISNSYITSIKKLNYGEISDFRLIDEEIEKVDIFIELNKEAEEIFKKYQSIFESNLNFFEIRNEFIKIRNLFYQFVISIHIKKASLNLPPLVSNIRYVSKNSLSNFYDLETGFKLNADFLIM